MLEYRITKYDPAGRLGGKRHTQWTAFSDIGRRFDGALLTRAAYEAAEAAYIAVALSFLREAGVTSLSVRGLECGEGAPCAYAEGDVLAAGETPPLMAAILREACWCRLEAPRGFVHFGWDFYMYVGVASACPDAARQAVQAGLFVEEMPSPHHPAQGRA